MSAFAGRVSGGDHGQSSLRGAKNPCPTGRIEGKTQEIEVDDYLPWLASN